MALLQVLTRSRFRGCMAAGFAAFGAVLLLIVSGCIAAGGPVFAVCFPGSYCCRCSRFPGLCGPFRRSWFAAFVRSPEGVSGRFRGFAAAAFQDIAGGPLEAFLGVSWLCVACLALMISPAWSYCCSASRVWRAVRRFLAFWRCFGVFAPSMAAGAAFAFYRVAGFAAGFPDRAAAFGPGWALCASLAASVVLLFSMCT